MGDTTSMAYLMQRLCRIGLLAALVALGGCASTRLIDSDVRSFRNGAPEPVAASFQFERLPSQQADLAVQTQIEQWAVPVLARAGLVLGSESPRYTVQLGLATEQMPRSEPVFVRRWGLLAPYSALGAPVLWMPLEPVLYRFQVQVLVRDARSRDVVYEASARHTGPWNDQSQILPAVLLAALRDFPQGNAGPSTVKVEIGPGGMELRP